ncbi:hypothetical protein AB1K70_26570 [Bremerella sp. JC770]|uniref:hypothetical protein n=1 Tax=Bremerella sp. JC770 TaxID=3232137 RepID=UPI00345936DA
MANIFSKRLEDIESETPAEPQSKRTPANGSNLVFGFVLVFCCLMSGFTFCDRFAPNLATWWNSPRHCQCQECEWIRANSRPTPPPSAMPMILPNRRPLTPIQPPAI